MSAPWPLRLGMSGVGGDGAVVERVSKCVCFVLALLDEQHLYIMAFVLRLGGRWGREWKVGGNCLRLVAQPKMK